MFPAPREIRWGDGPGSTAIRDVELDPSLPAQGYRLDVRAEGTAIRHADPAGLRYATQTLDALEEEGRGRAVEVVDHPDHTVRGYMLDVSRDRVPTNETLGWLVDVLSELRYNHLELYVEHTFAYADHEVVWRDASPLTAEDLRWLDRRCADAGIELVANQNTFGHMERWLRHERYRPRAECTDGAVNPFSGRPMPPATLAPTQGNADFALGLVREMAEAVASGTVHIGADEPFELGQGRSAPDVAARGRAVVYLEHLQRLLRPLIDEGRHVLFWGDVLRRHPELVDQLPDAGATAVVWSYEAPSDPDAPGLRLPPATLELLGLPDDHHRGFASHTASFVATGYPFWVAGGTSGWNTLIGRWSNARANLLDAAVVGRDAGAQGFLVTDWGDNGHLQPLEVSLLPMAYGAGVAWCAEANGDADVATLGPVVDAHTGTPGLGAALARLGDAYLVEGVTTFNGSPLFAALDPTRPLPLIGHAEPETHRATLRDIDDLLATVAALPSSSHRDAVLAAGRLARVGARRLAVRDGVPAVRDGVPAGSDEDLAADLREAVEMHAASWLASSRPGGLADAHRHLPASP